MAEVSEMARIDEWVKPSKGIVVYYLDGEAYILDADGNVTLCAMELPEARQIKLCR